MREHHLPGKEIEMEEQLASGGVAPSVEKKEAGELTVIQGSKPILRETEETKKLKENAGLLGPLTALYALFYAFCTYKNESGITFPFFVAGSLLYFYYTMKKLELTWKRGNAFYVVSVMLLAIATFVTDDARIISLNKLGIFLLMMSFLLSQFCNTEKWGLGKFAASIPGVLLTALAMIARPIQDVLAHGKQKGSKGTKRMLYVLLGLFITFPILLIVMALLGSADVFFRHMLEQTTDLVNFGNVFGIILSMILWYFGTYALLANLCEKTIKDEVKDYRSGEPILAITVTSMLSATYLLFCGIQIFGLFLGKLELPEGYTYAKYAREGFFQLLAVAILNLVIVLICLAFFRDSKVLKAVLTVMSLCTFIMIASSAVRMILYVSSYDLTFLRILVLWALAVLTLLFLGVMIQIFKKDFPLFRYGMAVVTILYVGLSFSHPDYIIAKYNLEYSVKEPVDVKYLSGLSADAAPVILPYLMERGYDVSKICETNKNEKPNRKNGEPKWIGEQATREEQSSYNNRWEQYLENIQREYQNQSIRNFNLSRYLAFKEADQ